MISVIFGLCSCFFHIIGTFYVLHKFGRRTIMIIGNFVMGVSVFMTGIGLLYPESEIWGWCSVINVNIFITAFSFSAGPVNWVYLAEILQPNAMSVAFFFHWGIIIIDAFALPDDPADIAYLFITCGIFTLIGFILIIIYVPETKGKNQTQIDRLFYKPSGNQKYVDD